jgi:hypothetical protein
VQAIISSLSVRQNTSSFVYNLLRSPTRIEFLDDHSFEYYQSIILPCFEPLSWSAFFPLSSAHQRKNTTAIPPLPRDDTGCTSSPEHPSRRLYELHLWIDFNFYRRIARHLNFKYMFALRTGMRTGPIHAVTGPVAIVRHTDYIWIRVWIFVRRRSRVVPLFLVPHPRGNCGDRYWCFLLSRHVILHKCHRHVYCGPARFCWPIYNWRVCNLRRYSGVPVSIPVTVCVPYRPETLDNRVATCRIP